MGIEELLSKREEILAIATRHDAHNVRVFGSFARGEARPDSDVDFLVDVGDHPSFFFPGGLIGDLQDLLGRKVDIATENGLHQLIRDQVMKEAKSL